MKIQATRTLQFGTLYLLLILCSVFTSCTGKPPAFWPANGTTLQNLSWNIALSDSGSVQFQENDVWILPVPADTAAVETTNARHLSAKDAAIPYFFKNVDQVVRYESGIVTAEYYAFRQDDVYILGNSSTDSSSLYTLYEPPLLLLPNDLKNLNANTLRETTPKIWDARADSFRVQPKMRIQVSIAAHGRVNYGDKLLTAVLVNMSLLQDAVVAYDDTGLIVPDAVTMQSTVLLVRDIGPVLEWGIKTGKNKQPWDTMNFQPEEVIQIIFHQSL
ncbi:MAG: hypothetical protein EHM72_04760 [Calditrichaeota bacterium]|nr:MAG: hypothetical protein EHM72_04760 [Calditrichota bacterium]